MRKYFLVAVVLFPWATHAQGNGSARCASFLPTLAKEVQVSSAPGWVFLAMQRSGNVLCRGEGEQGDGNSLTLICESSKQKGCSWHLSITSQSRRLKGREEVSAELLADKKTSVSGRVLAIQDSVGGKITNRYVRAEFSIPESSLTRIATARHLEVRAVGIKAIELSSLKTIFAAIKQCNQQASGPDKHLFWKDAKAECH